MPTLAELHDLFEVLPEIAPPGPRRRTTQPDKLAPPAEKAQPAAVLPLMQRLFPWTCSKAPTPLTPPRRPNPFAVLKQGKKMIVVAAVDAGTISFFRFGQGAFEDFPMS